MRWRAWPANVLTLTNLGAGALVCWWSASEFDLGWAPAEWLDSVGWIDQWMAFLGAEERRVAGLQWMLTVWMFGQLCDVLDGAVARWMGADSNQGAMLDSMADLVSAGLAPAFVGMALMVEWQAGGGMPGGMAWATLLPLLVLAAAAWRLARYAREAMSPKAVAEDRWFDFEGLPAPFAALYWGALLWVWSRCEGQECASLWMLGMVGATLLPLGMVSTWPQVGFKKWGEVKRWDQLRLAWLGMALLLCVLLPPLGVVLALISYPIFGAVVRWTGPPQ